jgi:hypothetical protein
VLTPGFHPALEVGAVVAQVAQPLRYELRRIALGAYREDRQIRGKLVGKDPLDICDDGVQHLIFTTKL